MGKWSAAEVVMEELTDERNNLLKQHEISNEQTNYQIVLLRTSNSADRIDNALCGQVNTETNHFKNVLKKVIIVVIKTLES